MGPKKSQDVLRSFGNYAGQTCGSVVAASEMRELFWRCYGSRRANPAGTILMYYDSVRRKMKEVFWMFFGSRGAKRQGSVLEVRGRLLGPAIARGVSGPAQAPKPPGSLHKSSK